MRKKCDDCYFYWGSPVGCHSDDADEEDTESGECVFWEPKYRKPAVDRYEQYQEEWN